ncbi:hypothetical protein QY903_07265 [Lactiplantibacillus paraplantarum]|uniref:hypothetical protein n=1 Tax=Lactiplantibacillus paraplantarum TaxID=60520 RepID=UPI003079F8DC
MQLTKHGWGAVISIFILVPILFKLSALLPVPTLYSGLTQDLLILLLFLLLNHFWFKIREIVKYNRTLVDKKAHRGL